MIARFTSIKKFLLFRLGTIVLLTAFFVTSSGVWETAQAQTVINLPALGAMVPTSPSFKPLQLKGIQVYPQNPLQFDFLVDKGQSHLTGQELKDEVARLTKYFLTCLTVPESDLWVNLSPYEKDRIAPHNFGVTQMGKDLLEQDYLLKQIVSSLSYPEHLLGERFWERVYKKAQERYGTTEIPTNMFNKVWIVPKTAEVFANINGAFVIKSQLDVMMEADYLALKKNNQKIEEAPLTMEIFREIILPELRKEVNEGKNFAVVRQVYDAMILATWYKRNLKDGFLGKVYIGQNKVTGIDVDDKNAKEKIFQQYLKSFKKRAYDYIREDYDPFTKKTIPRKYVAGGFTFVDFGMAGDKAYIEKQTPEGLTFSGDLAMAAINVSPTKNDGTIISFPDSRLLTNTHPFKAVPASRSRAMLAGLLNKWTLGIMFAIAVTAISPKAVEGATFTPDANGTVMVHVEHADQLGKAMEKLRLTYKELSPEAYKQSPYAGPLYEALDRVTDIKDKDHIKAGDRVSFDHPIPQNVLEALSGTVARAIQTKAVVPSVPAPVAPSIRPAAPKNDVGPTVRPSQEPTITPLAIADKLLEDDPLKILEMNRNKRRLAQAETQVETPIEAARHQSPVAHRDATDPQEIFRQNRENREKRDNVAAASSQAQTPQSAGAGPGGPPPPDDPWEFWSQGNIAMALAVLFGLVGIRSRGYTFSGVTGKIRKRKTLPAFSAASTPSAVPVFAQPLNGSPLPNVALSSPPASLGEKQILADDLSTLRLVANRKIVPPPPAALPALPVQEEMALAGDFGGTVRDSAMIASALGMWMDGGLFLLTVPVVFTCGIIGFVKRVAESGIRKKDMKPWLEWFSTGVESSTARGGQQAGQVTNLFHAKGGSRYIEEKITKQKRNWMFWQTWDKGPVFYRSMIDDLHKRFYKALPKKLVPVYNYAKVFVVKVLSHVRFATNGDMVEKAAHPHPSAAEQRESWVYDALKNLFRKVIRIFQMTSAMNGDHDYTRIGIPYRKELWETKLGNREMRQFFSAAGHLYYDKRVTKGYLKQTVSDGKKYRQKVSTNHAAVLRALREKGYISLAGYVNRRFKGLDADFKSRFPGYTIGVFDQIESALFGLPPGDAPTIPIEMHIRLTQGSAAASMRYAHIMVNHQDLEEAMDDILFEEEEQAVGGIFSQIFDQVQPYMSRRGYESEDPEVTRSLNDLWVKDEETAISMGLEDQYEMIKIFKEMLYEKMKEEAQQPTLAGSVFAHWEQKWEDQGEDPERMRRMFIDVAVEKFFTADTIAATKEFAERSEGSYGVFMNNTMDDSITLYQENQDVVIGLNHTEGVYAFASDPRALKSIGPNGEKIEEAMHLRDGEIVNLSFSPSGKIVVRSWMRVNGKWRESTQQELKERTYPTSEYVDGERNPYYAAPPVQYKNPRNPRTVVQEDLKNIPKILARAQEEWEDPKSFNAESTDYLSERISDTIKKKGNARLVLIGYDNSRKLAEHFKETTKDLIAQSKLAIDVIDANEFNESPSKFDIQPDDIVMVVSKSGATFSTKLAMRIVQALVDPENIFCISARIDSVLFTMMGQGLRPQDRRTKRIFVTGEFYPAETPVASEVLLMFQLQQLAINLTRRLETRNSPTNPLGIKFSAEKLEDLAAKITEHSIRMAQELTGIDIHGSTYAKADKEKKAIGTYLGNAAVEPFRIKVFMKFFVYGVLSAPGLLISHYIGLGWGWASILDVLWITEAVPFLGTEFLRMLNGRPAYGRDAAYDLFMAAPPLIASTQRNFISRLMTNRFKSIGPAAIYAENPTEDFVATHASDEKRGDINLRFSLKHKASEGRMGVNQATYAQTAIFGTNIIKGRPEIVDVSIDVPLEVDATKEETRLMDNTVGC